MGLWLLVRGICAVVFIAMVSTVRDWQQMPLRPGDDTVHTLWLLIGGSGCLWVLNAVLNDILTWMGW